WRRCYTPPPTRRRPPRPRPPSANAMKRPAAVPIPAHDRFTDRQTPAGAVKSTPIDPRRDKVLPLAGTCRRCSCRMAAAFARRLTLLLRLRDARDDGAWAQFVDLYAPLVFGFARKHGLQDADAADLTQDVLQAVSGAIQRLDYDSGRGSFRG